MYLNANEILPEELLDRIQDYVQGREIYIPKRPESHLGWGQKNGRREMLRERNLKIRHEHREGFGIEVLAARYNLSEDTVRKIVYCGKKRF